MTGSPLALRLLVAMPSVYLGILVRAFSWLPGLAAGLTVASTGLVLAASSLRAIRILVPASNAGKRAPHR